MKYSWFSDPIDWFKEWFPGDEGTDTKPYEPVILPSALATRTQELVHSFCDERENREGLVYWVGKYIGHGGVVTTLIVPDATATPGSVTTTEEENASIISRIAQNNLVLLGQAHSHPSAPGTYLPSHSPGDDAMTFSPFEGSISVVIGNYAASPSRPTTDWGVHRYIDGAYSPVQSVHESEHLLIVPSLIDRRFQYQENDRS